MNSFTDKCLFQEVFNNYLKMITVKKLDYQFKLKFTSKNKPQIEPYDYLKRISNYTKIQIPFLQQGQILAKRAFKDGFNENMIHRIIFTSIYLAYKMYIDDNYIKLKSWSNISYLPAKEILSLEFSMLQMLNYKLFIHENEFLTDYKNLRLFKIEDL